MIIGGIRYYAKRSCDDAIRKKSLSNEETEQIRAEVVIADVPWCKDAGDLLAQARIIAPKLYEHYRAAREILAENEQKAVEKIADLYGRAAQENSLKPVASQLANALEDAEKQSIIKEILATGVDFLPYAYTGATPIRVMDSNRNIGFMNKKGALVIPLQYEDAQEFQEPLTAVKKNGKWGII